MRLNLLCFRFLVQPSLIHWRVLFPIFLFVLLEVGFKLFLCLSRHKCAKRIDFSAFVAYWLFARFLLVVDMFGWGLDVVGVFFFWIYLVLVWLELGLYCPRRWLVNFLGCLWGYVALVAGHPW